MDRIIRDEKMRYDGYRFLSACFCQPQKNVFQEENLLENLTMILREICPGAAPFSAAMEESLRKFGDEDLLVEYSRLFVGPFGLKAPPYGSVYLDGERRVMGDSTMAVIRMYEEEGLSGHVEFADLPDHVSVELEFMSYLLFKEIEALRKSDIGSAFEAKRKQEKFLTEHLGRWIAPFCEKIKEETQNGFYSALADCASVFVGSSCPANLPEAAGEEVSNAAP